MLYRDSFDPSELIVIKRARPSTLLHLGAFVRLASGGPVGVISSLDEDDNATVAWLTAPPCASVLPDVCLVSASSACASHPTRAAARNS